MSDQELFNEMQYAKTDAEPMETVSGTVETPVEKAAKPKATKKKGGSIVTSLLMWTVAMVSVLVIVILTFSRIQISNELKDYFEEQVEEKTSVVLAEIQSEKDNLMGNLAYYVIAQQDKGFHLDYSADYKGEIDGVVKNTSICDGIIFYGTSGNVLNSDCAPKCYITSGIVHDVIKGEPMVNVIKNGSETDMIAGFPYGDEGAVFFIKNISNQEFVDRLGSITGAQFTVFDEAIRHATTIEGMTGTELANPSIVKEIAETKKDVKIETVIHGNDYLAVYFPLLDNEGNFVTTLFMGMNVTVVNNLLGTVIRNLIVLSVVVLILDLLILVFVVMIPQLKKPLNALLSATENLSSGEADLSFRLPENGNNEITHISRNINAFVGMLQNIVRELNEEEESLEEIGQTLSSNSQQSASATAEIMANIEGVKHQSENQATSVDNTSTILSESGKSFEELQKLIEDQVAGITESSAAIEEMIGNIASVTNSVEKMSGAFGELTGTVTDGQVKLKEVDERVQKISAQSQMLMEANSMISAIAKQTNLLAMNAAIEAAHAGDAGKGFSVVADEIRKLAENASGQSKTISGELKEISDSISRVVVSSGDSSRAFAQIVDKINDTDQILRQIKNAMEEQQEASKQILDALASMNSQAGEVDTQSKNLVENLAKVNSEMNNVSMISNTILGSMDEMTQGSTEINQSAQSVSELATRTSDDIETMKRILGQFKL